MSEIEKIKFQVETKRILQILANEIYDSPYALLRENAQNAYDAILMRQASENSFIPEIKITIEPKKIVISDNGIGMDKEVLSNNFWKAGSSGKRGNELAQKAGVVGTFGIGAMANFGVCERLEVKTRKIDSEITYLSVAEKSKLDIAQECIELHELGAEEMLPGTIVTAFLDNPINISNAIAYLKPYIEYLPIDVIINGENYSKRNIEDAIAFNAQDSELTIDEKIVAGIFQFKVKGFITRNAIIKLKIFDILVQSKIVQGFILFEQGKSHLMALRNYFGLSSVPLNSTYNFGGFANLSVLQPTAGREALSRDSIDFLNQIVVHIEKIISEKISQSEVSDRNPFFLNYVSKYNRFDLCQNIKITVKPTDESISLGKIKEYSKDKNIYYFTGTDASLIQTYGNENSFLLLVSQSNPRRQIQINCLNSNSIQQVSDSPQKSKIYDKSELSYQEFAVILRIVSTINEDYLISNVNVFFADISHGVPSLIEKQNDFLNIYISKNNSNILQLIQTFEKAYEAFNGFVKDYVRMHLYQKFNQYVPSATKEGAEALYKILMKNKELYKIEYSEQGEIESLFSDYLSGQVDFAEVLNKSKSFAKSDTQTVQFVQVGHAEQEFHDIISNQADQNAVLDEGNNNEPLPPILRADSETDKKLISADKAYSQLNNFKIFLGLSDKLFKIDRDFFLEPHTTKIIWGSHKVVYIFSHASNRLTLYYDIELKDKLDDESIGGSSVITTTIIMRNRIFIPIPTNLESSFKIKEGSKEFFIRYDLITETTF